MPRRSRRHFATSSPARQRAAHHADRAWRGSHRLSGRAAGPRSRSRTPAIPTGLPSRFQRRRKTMPNSVAEVTCASQGMGRSTATRLARDFSVGRRPGPQAPRRTPLAIRGMACADPGQGFRRPDVGQLRHLPLGALRSDRRPREGVLRPWRHRRRPGQQCPAGPVMTGRRRSYLEYWAPSHGMSVEVAIDTFPQKAEIQRFVQPDEIAELMAFVISPAAPG